MILTTLNKGTILLATRKCLINKTSPISLVKCIHTKLRVNLILNGNQFSKNRILFNEIKTDKRYLQQNALPKNVNQLEKTQSKQQQQANQQTNKKLNKKLKIFIITSVFGVTFWAFTKYLETESDLAEMKRSGKNNDRRSRTFSRTRKAIHSCTLYINQ